MTTITAKCLPFDTPQGRVPGYEILSHDSRISWVMFRTYDRQAQMPVDVRVHWTKWIEYSKRKWPEGGSVEAVVLKDGSTLIAEARYVAHNDGGYEKAPLLCRDAFKIVTMSSGHPLLEVVGVGPWAYSARDEAATAQHLIDPWERDNRAYRARTAAHG